MTNTHILSRPFTYIAPGSLREAIQIMSDAGNVAAVLSGGTHLLTMLKMDRAAPDVLVNIKNLPELAGFQQENDGSLFIGACETIFSIRRNPFIQVNYPALAEACASFGSVQIEKMGTIGGNVCNGSPASDSVPALMVHDARVVVTGQSGERILPLEDFLLGPNKVNLHRGEILRGILLPKPRSDCFSGFMKVSRVAADLAKVNLAVWICFHEGVVVECRIAMGAVGPVVMRCVSAEEELIGKHIDEHLIEKVAEKAAETIQPIDDIRSTAWYRRQVARVMLHDLLVIAKVNSNDKAISLEASQSKIHHSTATNTILIEKKQRKLIHINVNGRDVEEYVTPNQLLINLLRDTLQLTGTKYGCGLGECSACTVLVDGQPALACLILAASLDGCTVTTIEGLESITGNLDPLQEAFIENAAYQCGYCTPGMIMTLKGLFDDIAHPTEEEIRDYLKGNRCRCTGYISVVRAVESLVKNQEDKEGLNAS